MDHGDLLALQVVASVLGPELTLLVIATAGAEHVPEVAVGDLRVGRRGGDHQNAVVGIDFRGRDRHARVEVTDHELHAVADELVRHRNALLRIRNVVALLERDLLAENAAGGVDVVNSLLSAVGQLSAESGVRAGDRSGDAELDLGVGSARKRQRGGKRDARQQVFIHTDTPFTLGAWPSS